jgi:hypothetical protein
MSRLNFNTLQSRTLASGLSTQGADARLHKDWFLECFDSVTNCIRLYAARHFGDLSLAKDVDDQEMTHAALRRLTRPN